MPIQDRWEASKQYQVFTTPFTFLINEHGTIAAAGISSKQYFGYLLEAAGAFQESVPARATREKGATARKASGKQSCG